MKDNNEYAEITIKIRKEAYKDIVGVIEEGEICTNCFKERNIIIPLLLDKNDNTLCIFCDFATNSEQEEDWLR